MEALKKELSDVEEFAVLGQYDEQAVVALKKHIEKEEAKAFLSGKYDGNDAILEIFSGAGGQDAQDFAAMLLRMYQRFCENRGWRAAMLHETFGEGGGPEGRVGLKSATLQIDGSFAYGFMKKESGVHRLVRLSPFSSQQLRHTSFVLVNVLPAIAEDDQEIEIKPEEIEVDTFKASGPGGQYVNKTESAIRIHHKPTGLVVASQSERLQGKNKENALRILRAKLSQLKEDERKKVVKEIKGDLVSASWGNQIRSYVLHPYRMVKDLRTQYETSDTEGVLDGDLDAFIEAELKI